MKIISFDIGIKNMAYCIFDLNSEILKIKSWDVINLTDANDNIRDKCNDMVRKTGCICNKNATYYNGDKYYCKTHANKSGYKILEREIKIPENITITKIKEIMLELKINEGENKKKRQELKEELREYIRKNYLDKIKKMKRRTTVDYDLIEIGKRIKEEFNKILEMNDVTHVIIENQISPIATRMKTIQGMVAQYFIMKFEKINIEFISSSNKLKLFSTTGENYKDHKKDAIYYCKEVLKKNDNLSENIEKFGESKKKDDMADAFLQGLWYIKKTINKIDIKI
jgi:hypothetical protein